MIIDCHAHVIQNWNSNCGHSTSAIHLKYLQRNLAFTVARAFSKRDGRPCGLTELLDAHDHSWNGLADVGFRVGRFGQLEFTVDEDERYIQYMPVGMQNLDAPPELMLAQMTYAGVDHAVLQAGGLYGVMTSYNAFAQNQYPAKFTGLISVDEAMAGSPEMLTEVDRGAALGLKGVYYGYESFARHGFAWPIDDPRLDLFWERLVSHGLVLCLEINGAPSYDKQGYLGNMAAFARVLVRFPRLRCHLAMGIPVQFFAAGDHWNIPNELMMLYRRDGFLIELMFPITWGGKWDYPYPETRPLIRDARDKFGAEKLMWGSDMPNVERFCTYTQSLTYLTRYCDFLNGGDTERILGGNAAHLYEIPPKGSNLMLDRPKPAHVNSDLFTRYGLTRLINASGTETVLGASPVCPEVIEAVTAMVPNSVIMLELQSAACHVIARIFETEAGIVTNCTSAGIAVAVAACMTGADLARVEQLPDTTNMKNKVVLQRGHNVTYGGHITQNVGITGAKVVEIGAATECGAYQLRSAICPSTAAGLYVVSHHAVQSGLIDLPTFCQICHEHGVPVIVDGAAEPEPRHFLRAGADLVITSMQKQFASLTAATVAGRMDLVRAAYFQERGIGRPMKTAKEGVIATIAALERWAAIDRPAAEAELNHHLELGRERLRAVPGLTVTIELDSTSRLFSRLLIHVDPDGAGLSAYDISAALMGLEPAIAVRNLMADIGLLQIDLRRASEEQTE